MEKDADDYSSQFLRGREFEQAHPRPIVPMHRRPRAGIRRWLIAITVIALVVRVALVLASPHFRPPPYDATEFDRIAVSLAEHGRLPASIFTARGGPTAFRPPLFPLALAVPYKILGTHSAHTRWRAGRLLEAGLGTLAVLLSFLIGLRLWGRAAAIVIGTIAALYPPLVMAGSSLMSESLFIPLVLAAVLAGLAARSARRPATLSILAGVLVGLASLTRGNGIVVLLALVPLVWARPRIGLKRIRAPLAMILATVVVLAPWTIRNALELHAFVPLTTETGSALAGTYNARSQANQALWRPPLDAAMQIVRADPAANEATVSSHLTSMARHYIAAHPFSLVRTAYWNTARLFNLTGTGIETGLAPIWGYPDWLVLLSVYAFWIVGALAVGGAVTRLARQAPASIWICPLLLLLSAVPLLGLTRYRMPADPFFVMLAALALLTGFRRVVTESPPLPSAAG